MNLSPDDWDTLGLQYFCALLLILGGLWLIEKLIERANRPRIKRTPYSDARSSIDLWHKERQERRRETTRGT